MPVQGVCIFVDQKRHTLAAEGSGIQDMCTECVGIAIASETWAEEAEEEQRMERNENVMLRWMCGVTLRDKVPTVELRIRLGIEGVCGGYETREIEVVRACREKSGR